MARKRMIDPSWLESESLGRCSITGRLLFFGLITLADDEGRLRGDPQYLRSVVFPYDREVEVDAVEKCLDYLVGAGCIIRYEVESRAFISLTNWGVYQKIDHPTSSKIPSPPLNNEPRENFAKYSRKIRENFAKYSRKTREASRKVPPNIIQCKSGKQNLNSLSGKPDEIPYQTIIDDMNSQLKTSYKHTSKATQRLIHARWHEGFRAEDFAAVVRAKKAQWQGDAKMKLYLRPETLFGTKFESYLQESKMPSKKLYTEEDAKRDFEKAGLKI